MTESFTTETSFDRLIRLRKSWREFHKNQDQANADLTFHSAGITRGLEEELFSFPEHFRNKLRDFGRDWELHLAATAIREGYIIYGVRLLLAIPVVQIFYEWIVDRLETGVPNLGTPLFFESNGEDSLHEENWDCMFYFALKNTHDPDSLAMSASPGVQNLPKFSRIA